MRQFIKKYFIILIVLNLIIQNIPAFHIAGELRGLLFSSLTLTIIYTAVFSIMNVVLFPVHLLTMNMSNWILRIILVYLWSLISPGISITSWNFPGMKIGPMVLSQAYLPYFLSVLVICLAILLTTEVLVRIMK
jgi:hypothetical protein